MTTCNGWITWKCMAQARFETDVVGLSTSKSMAQNDSSEASPLERYQQNTALLGCIARTQPIDTYATLWSYYGVFMTVPVAADGLTNDRDLCHWANENWSIVQ